MVVIETCGYDKNMKLIKTYSNDQEACIDSRVDYYKYKGNGEC